MDPVPAGDIVTLRELYQLIEKVRSDVLAEVKLVQTELDSKLVLHDKEHERDRDHRSSLTRWAVTSILSAVGVLIAIYVAFKGAT